MVAPMMGSGGVCVWQESGVRLCRFCVGAFGRNQASVAVKIFLHLIYFIKKIYTFYTFNAICKDIILLFNTNNVHSRQL
jgi:hypothetical protein